jgi:DNA helicase-2/ATP-dependent DNA helicase PcrA
MPVPPIQQLWKNAGFTPNRNQERAIRHLKGPLYLPAGPGSGKTRVLLWRALNLIVYHDVKPAEIFLATFTEKAAFQLSEGLRALLGEASEHTGVSYDLSQMYVGTAHSLFYRILQDRRFSPGGGRKDTPVLLDELGQYLYLYKGTQWKRLLDAGGFSDDAAEEINTCFGSRRRARHYAVANCIALFNRLSEECAKPEQASRKARDQTLRKLLRMYEAYCDSLVNDSRPPQTDFALLQQKALLLLESLQGSERAFRHVIIDEYQDTNTIQERLYFKLASGHKNLCVVGDDDQALYRFRGATVENFVEFPERCRRYLGCTPKEIKLVVNYRSRKKIVDFYSKFICDDFCDWAKPLRGQGAFRIEKSIVPVRKDAGPSVVVSTPGRPEEVNREIAALVRKIIKSGKVQDPNQIAFLFPSLKVKQARSLIDALNAQGLLVYAPRAGHFLEVDEAKAVFGVFIQIFGRPERDRWQGDWEQYHNWLDKAEGAGRQIVREDSKLARYVENRRAEIETVISDYERLTDVRNRKGWDEKTAYEPSAMKRALAEAPRLSRRAHRSLTSARFERVVTERADSGERPFALGYIINRATSLDWNVLDLFYQLCSFRFLRKLFELAEDPEPDEGPICNLSLISQYLARYVDEYASILTGKFLTDDGFERTFFNSYLYALFVRGESEYENADDPFPKGRVPFLTIHQAKGLEFPVVVLGNPQKNEWKPRMEEMVRPFLARGGEPLDRIPRFDTMRMFYVALSRAQNLLVIPHLRGKKNGSPHAYGPIAGLIEDKLPRIASLSLASLPAADTVRDDLPRNYSYTGDYLTYKRCPRQYMIFRKYGFAPSRVQTMFFGSLVHQTLEDLHRLLIHQRSQE